MSDVFLWAVIFVTAIFIYMDATANKIGKIPGKRSLTNNSAGVWAIGTIFLWIVVFPLYLIKRGELIQLAKENPVSANNRTGVIILTGFIGAILIAVSWVGVVAMELPFCDSFETSQVVSEIINSQPEAMETGLRYVAVNEVIERGYNPTDGIRACTGTLITNSGELPIHYNVTWLDDARTSFQVEVGYL